MQNTILFLLSVEDVIKDKVEPYPSHLSPYRSFEIQETKSISQHASPIPVNADDTAVPIDTPGKLNPFPRIPTPPEPIMSPVPTEKIDTPSALLALSLMPAKNIFSFHQESAFVVDFDKVRRGSIFRCHAYRFELKSFSFLYADLLAAIEERTIPALEDAIQQVKDFNYFDQLKYECERALELLNRLMKIEHMK